MRLCVRELCEGKALSREVDETRAREDVPAELTLHEAHVVQEAHEAVVLRVNALKGSRDFLSFFLFIGFYVQLLVGGTCGGYIRIV